METFLYLCNEFCNNRAFAAENLTENYGGTKTKI